MKVITPPTSLDFSDNLPSVFLAGSIAMGEAEDWQNELIRELANWQGVILNPRRADWDSSWEQSIDHPQFKEQVTWELDGLEKASLIVMYFEPKTKAPITLLELGLMARNKQIVLCCPEGFWRKGNVDIVCERFGIEQVAGFRDFVPIIQKLT